MSRDNVGKFYEALKNDSDMARLLQRLAEDIGEMTEAHAAELIVKFAAEKGYSFSMEELQEFESETKELSREELDRINAADGIGKHGAFCRWYPWL